MIQYSITRVINNDHIVWVNHPRCRSYRLFRNEILRQLTSYLWCAQETIVIVTIGFFVTRMLFVRKISMLRLQVSNTLHQTTVPVGLRVAIDYGIGVRRQFLFYYFSWYLNVYETINDNNTIMFIYKSILLLFIDAPFI